MHGGNSFKDILRFFKRTQKYQPNEWMLVAQPKCFITRIHASKHESSSN